MGLASGSHCSLLLPATTCRTETELAGLPKAQTQDSSCECPS